MITSNSVQFGDDGTLGTQRFQEIRSAAYEHLLSRIEELGAEFGRWSRSAIQEFVNIEVAGFVRMRRVPVNESERSEEHTSELQSLMRISYAVFCLKKKKYTITYMHTKTKIRTE